MRTKTKAPRPGGATLSRAERCGASAAIVAEPARVVKRRGTPIFVRGHVVANVSPDGVLRKRIRGHRHMLRRPPAIAFAVEAIEQALALGAERIEVFDMDGGRRYAVSMSDFLRHGVEFDRGHGRQIFLRLGLWRDPDSPAQLRLFDPSDGEAGGSRESFATGPTPSPMLSSAEPRPREEGGSCA